MAKKQVAAIVKIQIPAGKATPAPPVGTALGPHGIAIMDFVKQYNAATEANVGTIIPVEVTVYADRSFTFITKTPPASDLLKKAAGIEKGSKSPRASKVATIPESKLREIAELKLKDLNALDVPAAMHIIEGTARSMGIMVEKGS